MAAVAAYAALAVMARAKDAPDVGLESACAQHQMAHAGPPPKHRNTLGRCCTECRNATDRASGLALDVLSLEQIASDADIQEKVVLEFRTEVRLDRASIARPNPGINSLHRIDRNEYANAIRGVLDLDIDATSLLPADDSAAGFDVSPCQLLAVVRLAQSLGIDVNAQNEMGSQVTTIDVEGAPGATYYNKGRTLDEIHG